MKISEIQRTDKIKNLFLKELMLRCFVEQKAYFNYMKEIFDLRASKEDCFKKNRQKKLTQLKKMGILGRNYDRSLYINRMFALGSAVGILLIPITLIWTAMFVISDLPLLTIKGTIVVAIQYIGGTFVSSWILPQILGFLFASPLIIVEWIIAQADWVRANLYPKDNKQQLPLD